MEWWHMSALFHSRAQWAFIRARCIHSDEHLKFTRRRALETQGSGYLQHHWSDGNSHALVNPLGIPSDTIVLRWALAKRVLLKVWFQKGPILSFSSLSVGDHCMLYLLSRKFFWHYLQVFNYNFELWWLFATPAVPLSKMEFRRCMLCLLATPCLNKS